MSTTFHVLPALQGERFRIIAAFTAIYLIWGSTYLATRFAIETLPPFLMAGTRFLLAGSVLYGVARLSGAHAPQPGHWRSAAAVGAFLLVGGVGGVTWAEQTIPSGVAALLAALIPLWVILLEWLLGHSTPRVAVMVGLLLGIGGVAVLVGPSGVRSQALHSAGVAAVIAGSASWAIGSLYARQAHLPRSQLLATSMEMLTGGMMLAVIGLLGGEGDRLELASVSPHSLAALGYLVVFGSIITFTAYTWLLRVSTPARVSTYAFVNPAIAVLLGWLVGQEALSSRLLLAAALIVSAVALITTMHHAPQAARTERVFRPLVSRTDSP